jgi:hypothetical protein
MASARHRTPQRHSLGGKDAPASLDDSKGITLSNSFTPAALAGKEATEGASAAVSAVAAPPATFAAVDSDAFSVVVDRVVSAYKWCQRSPVGTNVLILAVLSLTARLYRISTPDGVVFDEYHFGRFVNNYLDGNYFFDIHPPLGKLTLAALGYVTCVKGGGGGAVGRGVPGCWWGRGLCVCRGGCWGGVGLGRGGGGGCWRSGQGGRQPAHTPTRAPECPLYPAVPYY